MVDLYAWERPFGDPSRADRDIEAEPYTRQERRVVEYLQSIADMGGGDDPIGFLIASHAFNRAASKATGDKPQTNTDIKDDPLLRMSVLQGVKTHTNAELDRLIKKAVAEYNAMTPEQKEEQHRLQRESWARQMMD